MNKFGKFLETKGINQEQFDAKSAEDQTALYSEFNDLERKALEALIEAKASKKDIDELKKSLETFKDAQMAANTSAMKTLSLQVKKLSGKTAELPEAEKEIDTFLENFEKGAQNKFIEKPLMITKANFVNASIANNTTAQRSNEIGQIGTRKTTIYDLFRKIPILRDQNGTYRYIDWDAATTDRAAAVILEGGTFPESTAKFAEYSLTLKKVGDTIPISEESLYDRARFTAELRMFLDTNVDIVIDNQLYNGDNIGANAFGITTRATTYVPVGANLTDVSIYDLLVKMRETVNKGKGTKYAANYALMNITVINQMKLKKDANNNYVMPPFVDAAGNIVDRMIVIESNVFGDNELLVGDNRYGAIIEEPGMFIGAGLNGTDWTEDMVTLKARKRMNLLIREADKDGHLHCTDIAAALVALAGA